MAEIQKRASPAKLNLPGLTSSAFLKNIAILHKERYLYPKKDGQGKVTMVPMWKKEAENFYCVKKECILRRHPYFWKGMIKIGSDVEHQLKDGHLKLLKEVFHLSL